MQIEFCELKFELTPENGTQLGFVYVNRFSDLQSIITDVAAEAHIRPGDVKRMMIQQLMKELYGSCDDAVH